jgi:hypothetical protein
MRNRRGVRRAGDTNSRRTPLAEWIVRERLLMLPDARLPRPEGWSAATAPCAATTAQRVAEGRDGYRTPGAEHRKRLVEAYASTPDAVNGLTEVSFLPAALNVCPSLNGSGTRHSRSAARPPLQMLPRARGTNHELGQGRGGGGRGALMLHAREATFATSQSPSGKFRFSLRCLRRGAGA